MRNGMILAHPFAACRIFAGDQVRVASDRVSGLIWINGARLPNARMDRDAEMYCRAAT